MKEVIFEGKIFNSINIFPYNYKDFMVILNDLVHALLPSISVSRCVDILRNYLDTTLYSANS